VFKIPDPSQIGRHLQAMPSCQPGHASRCIIRNARSVVMPPAGGCKDIYKRALVPPSRPPASRPDRCTKKSRRTESHQCTPRRRTASGSCQADHVRKMHRLLSSNTERKKQGATQTDAGLDQCQEVGSNAECQKPEDKPEDDVQCDDSASVSASKEKLESFACPRRRRKKLLWWVNQRVQEIGDEDAEDPDSEDEDIKSLLMDAVGHATVNVESDMGEDSWDFQTKISGTCYNDMSPSSKVSFADNTKTYVMTCIGDEAACTISWALDSIVDMNVFDSPSAPLRKWRQKSCTAQ